MKTFDWKKHRKIVALSGMGILLIVLVIIFYSGGGGEKIRRLAQSDLQTAPAIPESPEDIRTITLFFLSDTDDLLHPEEREVVVGLSPSEEAERVLVELVKGSEKDLLSPLPQETEIRQIFITKEGVAYVDFSRDVMERYSYGSSSELAAVFSVVNTLAYNYSSIKKVAILVEGVEKETLGGHVDLSKPLVPDFSLIAK